MVAAESLLTERIATLTETVEQMRAELAQLRGGVVST
jgi:uncharacterized small protein (DUF1192 family)